MTKCEYPDCDEKAAVHVTQVKAGAVSEVNHLCEQHATETHKIPVGSAFSKMASMFASAIESAYKDLKPGEEITLSELWSKTDASFEKVQLCAEALLYLPAQVSMDELRSAVGAFLLEQTVDDLHRQAQDDRRPPCLVWLRHSKIPRWMEKLDLPVGANFSPRLWHLDHFPAVRVRKTTDGSLEWAEVVEH